MIAIPWWAVFIVTFGCNNIQWDHLDCSWCIFKMWCFLNLANAYMNLLGHVILCFFLFAVLWDYSHHSLLLPWEFAVPVRILFIQHCSESFSDIANILYGDWRNENTFNAIQVKPDIHCSLLWSILFCYDHTMGWIGKYLAIFHCYIRVWEFIWQFLNLKKSSVFCTFTYIKTLW